MSNEEVTPLVAQAAALYGELYKKAVADAKRDLKSQAEEIIPVKNSMFVNGMVEPDFYGGTRTVIRCKINDKEFLVENASDRRFEDRDSLKGSIYKLAMEISKYICFEAMNHEHKLSPEDFRLLHNEAMRKAYR